MIVDDVAEFEGQLIDTQIDFGLNLFVEELLVQRVEGAKGGVVVNIEWIENVFDESDVSRLENLVNEDPGQREINLKLQSLCEIEIKLAVPQISEICHLSDGIWEREENSREQECNNKKKKKRNAKEGENALE